MKKVHGTGFKVHGESEAKEGARYRVQGTREAKLKKVQGPGFKVHGKAKLKKV